MMTDLLLIFGIILIAAFFWQLRQMAEQSRRFAEKACQKQNVQLISIAKKSARPSLSGHSGISWKARYQFEFSTDGMNQYEGHLHMLGNRLTKIEWPVFVEPQWQDAPKNVGSIGTCSLRGGCSTKKKCR